MTIELTEHEAQWLENLIADNVINHPVRQNYNRRKMAFNIIKKLEAKT